MLAVVVLMAVCYPAIKAGLPHAPPLRFGGLRTLIGGIFLLLIAILTKRPVIPGTRLILWIVPLAIVSTSLTYAFMFSSPAFIDAGVASVLGNTQPLFIAGFAVLVLGEMMSRTKLAALSLGFLGVVILTAPAMSDTNPVNLTGALLALGTSASAALASVWMKWLRPRSCLLALTGWQLSVGGLILLACSAIWEPNSAVRWSGSLVALLMVLAVFGTALATLLWYWCLQHREAGELAAYLFLIPVLGVLISVLWLGERPGPAQLAGMALIVASVGLASQTARRSSMGRSTRRHDGSS